MMLFLFAALACACSGSGGLAGSVADVSGSYTGTLTNGSSTCPGNWTVGETADVNVTASQAGESVTLDVTGSKGLVAELLLGAHTFNGKVSGHHVTTTLRGSRTIDDGECHYSWNGKFEGELVEESSTLQGGIVYTPVTNGSPDCVAKQIQDCSSIQTYVGTRPQ